MKEIIIHFQLILIDSLFIDTVLEIQVRVNYNVDRKMEIHWMVSLLQTNLDVNFVMSDQVIFVEVNNSNWLFEDFKEVDSVIVNLVN